jgi:hypothetical protein
MMGIDNPRRRRCAAAGFFGTPEERGYSKKSDASSRRPGSGTSLCRAVFDIRGNDEL